MDTVTVLIILLVLLVAAVAVAALVSRRRRSARLQDRFGAEYDHAREEAGSRHSAEAELRSRQKRIEALQIKPLEGDARDRYLDAWAGVQAQFVDDPQRAVGRADRLVGEVMSARGYPVTDFDQRSADLSVEHPAVVQHYRAAHDVALRHERGEADTEDLRQALIHYRALFEDLVGEPPRRAA